MPPGQQCWIPGGCCSPRATQRRRGLPANTQHTRRTFSNTQVTPGGLGALQGSLEACCFWATAVFGCPLPSTRSAQLALQLGFDKFANAFENRCDLRSGPGRAHPSCQLLQMGLTSSRLPAATAATKPWVFTGLKAFTRTQRCTAGALPRARRGVVRAANMFVSLETSCSKYEGKLKQQQAEKCCLTKCWQEDGDGG